MTNLISFQCRHFEFYGNRILSFQCTSCNKCIIDINQCHTVILLPKYACTGIEIF